ncbi:MAG: tRNA pseudouridine(55) synthase TruB [Rickettsiales bacterium]
MSQKPKKVKNRLNGWINLDKPYGMTSTEAVSRVKRLLSPEKIGHAGTLDPLATGILPLALGEATKTVQYAMDAEKTYRFTVKFGEQTTTDDREGEITTTSDKRPQDTDIKAILKNYIGEIEQIPPVYSAIKIGGERAYDLARAGAAPKMEPRIVYIDDLQLIERPDADRAVFEVSSGKGMYVRSLARDISLALGTVGHVADLRRISVGSFDEQNAVLLEEIEKGLPSENVTYITDTDVSVLLPLDVSLDDIPALRVDQSQETRLRHGGEVFVSRACVEDAGHDFGSAGMYRAYSSNTLVALVERQGRRLKPVRVFHV